MRAGHGSGDRLAIAEAIAALRAILRQNRNLSDPASVDTPWNDAMIAMLARKRISTTTEYRTTPIFGTVMKIVFSCSFFKNKRFGSIKKHMSSLSFLASSQLSGNEASSDARPRLESLAQVPALQCVYHDRNFIVIDKPIDVRMDGPHELTVSNLLLRTFGGSAGDFKWVHQLDMATSGCLLVGLNRAATAQASEAFALRLTRKVYSALVYGRVEAEDFPTIERSLVEERAEAMDREDRRRRARAAQSSPRASNWQDRAKSTSLALCLQALQRLIDECSAVSEHPALPELRAIAAISALEFSSHTRLRKVLRKVLKRYDCLPQMDHPEEGGRAQEAPAREPEDCAPEYSFNHKWVRDESGGEVYRVQGLETDPETIFVSIPLAEVDHQFPCEFSREENPGKAAITVIEIVGRGRWRGQDVTKLRLHPRTGRRHQLRLHCLALGHPIVGDVTYADPRLFGSDRAPRMMLHALSLRVPIRGWRDKSTKELTEDFVIDVQTDDPFNHYLDI